MIEAKAYNFGCSSSIRRTSSGLSTPIALPPCQRLRYQEPARLHKPPPRELVTVNHGISRRREGEAGCGGSPFSIRESRSAGLSRTSRSRPGAPSPGLRDSPHRGVADRNLVDEVLAVAAEGPSGPAAEFAGMGLRLEPSSLKNVRGIGWPFGSARLIRSGGRAIRVAAGPLDRQRACYGSSTLGMLSSLPDALMPVLTPMASPPSNLEIRPSRPAPLLTGANGPQSSAETLPGIGAKRRAREPEPSSLSSEAQRQATLRIPGQPSV